MNILNKGDSRPQQWRNEVMSSHIKVTRDTSKICERTESVKEGHHSEKAPLTIRNVHGIL